MFVSVALMEVLEVGGGGVAWVAGSEPAMRVRLVVATRMARVILVCMFLQGCSTGLLCDVRLKC